jgi:hypothetical protein
VVEQQRLRDEGVPSRTISRRSQQARGLQQVNGVSGWLVETPEAIGYSKLMECAMISWPGFETK